MGSTGWLIPVDATLGKDLCASRKKAEAYVDGEAWLEGEHGELNKDWYRLHDVLMDPKFGRQHLLAKAVIGQTVIGHKGEEYEIRYLSPAEVKRVARQLNDLTVTEFRQLCTPELLVARGVLQPADLVTRKGTKVKRLPILKYIEESFSEFRRIYRVAAEKKQGMLCQVVP